MSTICGIIGDPVEHSLSPAMHNAGYKRLGLDFEYKKFHTPAEQLKEMIQRIRDENIRGVSVTIPHKVEVIKYLDEIDPLAEKIGAVNTIVHTDGVLKGYNTDWEGCMEAIEEVVPIPKKRVALLGAGGAARAIAFGVLEKGGELTIYNRNIEKARLLGDELGVPAKALSDIHSDYEIIINSTSVGMGELEDQSPVPAEILQEGMVVHDIVYKPERTKLLQDAQKAGCKIIPGYKMLLCQGFKQFLLFTGKNAPKEVMESALQRE